MVPSTNEIAAVRRFSRFYTRQIDLLNKGLLRSRFSLTEARVLWELADRGTTNAADLGRDLGLDGGYLSRILKRFEEDGFLARRPSPDDARQTVLSLTEDGRRAFQPIDQGSRDQVTSLLAPLSRAERQDLVAAMKTVEALLGARDRTYDLRPLRVGDIGWIARRQGMLYAEEYGFDGTFEALVAEIGAAFAKNFDPAWENAWVAERDGVIIGSVFVARSTASVAKLRLLYVEPTARGLGLGRRLVDECIAFARACGYATLTLWTNNCLFAALKIYRAAGFRLVDEEKHHSFGKDLVGQTWTLDL